MTKKETIVKVNDGHQYNLDIKNFSSFADLSFLLLLNPQIREEKFMIKIVFIFSLHFFLSLITFGIIICYQTIIFLFQKLLKGKSYQRENV